MLCVGISREQSFINLRVSFVIRPGWNSFIHFLCWIMNALWVPPNNSIWNNSKRKGRYKYIEIMFDRNLSGRNLWIVADVIDDDYIFLTNLDVPIISNDRPILLILKFKSIYCVYRKGRDIVHMWMKKQIIQCGCML